MPRLAEHEHLSTDEYLATVMRCAKAYGSEITTDDWQRRHHTGAYLILIELGIDPARTDAKIWRDAEAMIEQYGTDAPIRAAEQLNARITASDMEGRDHWAQVVHAIHTLMRRFLDIVSV